ncbi:uncharacterized protein LOC113550424 [Rhopalosiphum maidis]|uniref:uncharacterized protein LOC113550424 n=1 Tax=Rhopalosiphum maidis TaxID=43146 RepID=UPI000F00C582|nr:uncharacterized protein LOC113550424 [Rhopalosiphum maidis]
MKHHIFFMFVQVIFTASLGSSVNINLFKNSSIGPYELEFQQAYNCNPKKHNKIQHNMYVSKRGNKIMLFGNSTLEAPFDDTLFLEMKIAEKDSFGRWKENTYMQKIPNACSSMKKLLGNSWTAFMNGAGSQNTICPILPGIYISPGLDPLLFKESNLPKSFFYGTYKVNVYYTKNNQIFGCQAFIIEVKRS